MTVHLSKCLAACRINQLAPAPAPGTGHRAGWGEKGDRLGRAGKVGRMDKVGLNSRYGRVDRVGLVEWMKMVLTPASAWPVSASAHESFPGCGGYY